MSEINKYQLGKIYKVVNTINDLVYFGSTAQKKLSARMGNHREKAGPLNKTSKFYTHMREIGIEYFKIVLIKNFPCASVEELEAEEYRIMNEYDSTKLLNDNTVYNKRSPEHIKKVADAQRGQKSSNWKYGSVHRKNNTSKEGWCCDAWCFVYRCKETDTQRRLKFSIKKFGEEGAKQLAENKRKEIYPESNINIV